MERDAAKVFESYDLDKDGFITLEETMQNSDLIQSKYIQVKLPSTYR